MDFICTNCDNNAYIGYSNWQTGDGKIVQDNERLCRICFDERIATYKELLAQQEENHDG